MPATAGGRPTSPARLLARSVYLQNTSRAARLRDFYDL